MVCFWIVTVIKQNCWFFLAVIFWEKRTNKSGNTMVAHSGGRSEIPDLQSVNIKDSLNSFYQNVIHWKEHCIKYLGLSGFQTLVRHEVFWTRNYEILGFNRLIMDQFSNIREVLNIIILFFNVVFKTTEMYRYRSK